MVIFVDNLVTGKHSPGGHAPVAEGADRPALDVTGIGSYQTTDADKTQFTKLN